MSNVDSLIDALASGSASDANKAFDSIMKSKLETAFDTKKIEMANQVYNGVEQDIVTDEVDD